MKNMKNMKRNENLFNEMGMIDDKFIPVDSSGEANAQLKWGKPGRWHFAPMIAAALVLLIGGGLMLNFLAPEQHTPATGDTTAHSTISSSVDTTPLHADGFHWILKPTYEYQSLTYCPLCDIFYNEHGQIICETTGEEMGLKNAHGGMGSHIWTYDPTLEVFGFEDNSGFALFGEPPAGIVAVYEVDSTMTEQVEAYYSGVFLREEAFTGKIALVVDGGFISGFSHDAEFTDGRIERRQTGRGATVAAVNQDGRWGVIGTNGNVIAFVFDEIRIINDHSAFAKMDGVWGILALEQSGDISSNTAVNLFNWVLKPTYEYAWLWYCSECEVFYNENERVICEKTGEDLGKYNPHPSDIRIWVYDPEQDLFGFIDYHGISGDYTAEIHPSEEFTQLFPELVNPMKAVVKIDTSFSTEDNPGQWGGNYALHFEGKFITDFIYFQDEYHSSGATGKDVYNIAPVAMSGKWGIMNNNAGVTIPFLFDRILLIDENSAFAKMDGVWGILDISEVTYVDVVELSPGDRITEEWQVVLAADGEHLRIESESGSLFVDQVFEQIVHFIAENSYTAVHSDLSMAFHMSVNDDYVLMFDGLTMMFPLYEGVDTTVTIRSIHGCISVVEGYTPLAEAANKYINTLYDDILSVTHIEIADIVAADGRTKPQATLYATRESDVSAPVAFYVNFDRERDNYNDDWDIVRPPESED
jgi:hypothetical protein